MKMKGITNNLKSERKSQVCDVLVEVEREKSQKKESGISLNFMTYKKNGSSIFICISISGTDFQNSIW